MTVNDAVVSGASASSSAGAVNLSLIKISTITQTLLGIAVTGLVVLATVVTIVLISTRAGFEPPLAFPDSATTYKYNTIDIYPLVNDQNPRGDNLTLTYITDPDYGSAIIIDGNKVQFTAPKYWAGTLYMNYTCMNDKLTAMSTITVFVTNRPPEPISQVYTISKNSIKNQLDMFGYTNTIGQKISDIDQDLMYLVNATQPSHGVVSFDNNYVYYTPEYNYISGDYFEYCVSDFNDTACSFVNVTVMNDPPVAVTDTYQIPKNTPASFNVMSNDYDPNNDTISISEVTPAAYGAVTASSDNTRVRYTPIMSAEVYSDSFSYGITDGILFGYAYVTVDVGNLAPVAGDLTLTIHKNTNETFVDLPATDGNALDVLTITIPVPSTIGSFKLTNTPDVAKVDINGDEYTKIVNNYRLWYTPLYGVSGVYSEVIKYNVFDGTDTTVGTVTINVINDAPTAVADTITADKNLFVTYNVIANDFDINNDEVQLNNVGATVNTAEGGYYRVVDSKNIEYHPRSGFLGNDTATYTITDIQTKQADQLTATGTLLFIVGNNAPRPKPDVYTVSKGHTKFLDVIANDTDPNFDGVTLDKTGTPNSGAVVTGSDDGITYSALNQTYTESWFYTAKDTDNETAVAQVTVHVVNDPPVAVDDSINVKWNSTTLIDVLVNDRDVNPGDKELLTIKTLSGTKSQKGGDISIISNKLVQYSPVPGYTGPDSFTYTIFDQIDDSTNSATVSITVGNNAPTANPASVTVHWSASLPVNILGIAGNGDPDNDPIVVSAVTPPTNGTVTLVDGVATYKSTAFYTGPDSFTYTLFDWELSASNTVTVNVQNVAPVAAPVSLTLPWNAGPTVAYVTGVCTDADNDPLSVKTVTPNAPFTGGLTISDDKANVVFTPSKNFRGVQTAAYVVTDGPDTDASTITITVTNENKPTASNVTRTVHWSTESVGTTVSLLSVGQTDADGDALTVSAVSGAAHGTVTFTNTSVTYKQNAGYTGRDEFSYTVTDGLDTATAYVIFNIYNTAPVAVDHAYSVFWGTHTTGTTFAVLTDSSDADSEDTVTLKSVTTPSQGTAVINNNQVLYKPAQGNLNTATFDYTATDGLADVTKRVTVTITNAKPVAVVDAVSVHWNTTSTEFNIKTNDYDADNDPITLSDITDQTPAGNVAIKSAAAGTVTYTLPTVFALGVQTAKYTITDGALTSDKANINIDITNTNQPSASPVNSRVHWRTANAGYSIPITGLTTTDGDGDRLSLSVSGSTFATAIASTPSYVRYQHALWRGTDTVNYQITDGKSSASSVVNVESFNTQPTAQDINNVYVPFTSFVNGLSINIFTLGAVADADNEDTPFLEITAVGSTQTVGSTVTINANKKSVLLKPINTWTGTDSFTFTVSDGLDSVTKTVNVYTTYIAAGDAERYYDVHWSNYATGKTFTVLDGYGNTGSSRIISIASTAPGGNTAYTIQPALDQINNNLFFQNKKEFLGVDLIKLNANDGATSGVISVYMTVYDNAPTASNKVATGKWSEDIATVVMSDAADQDTEDTPTLASFTSGTNGVVTQVNPTTLSYKATAGFVGSDSYTYTVTDGLLTTTRVVSVTVTNTPPVPAAQAYSVHWRTFQTGVNKVLTTGSYDADGDTVTLVSVTAPDDATAGTTTAVVASNSVNIVGPVTPYYGKSYKFGYTVKDGAQNGQVSQQVTVSVTNSAPVAVADTDSIHWRTTLYSKNVLENDYDNDSEDTTFLKVSGATSAAGGTITFSNTHITYTPKAQWTGTDVITYTITDGAQTASTTYTIEVTDAAPSAKAIAVSMHSSLYETGINVPVTTNPTTALKPTDTDSVDVPFLHVSAVVQPRSPATATFDATSVTFKSGSQTQLGVTTVTYTVSDGLKTGQNAISVTVYNNAPTNTDYPGTCPWRTCLSTGVTVTVTTNAADVDPEDAGKLVYAQATQPTYGTVSSTVNGQFVYKLKSGQGNVNSDSFKFTTSDGVQTVQNTVNIVIGNTAPVARDDSYLVHWLSVQPFAVLVRANDTDADSDPFTIQYLSATTSSIGAALSISSDKLQINYNLAKNSITANKLGVADKFTYRITDTVDSSNTATATVTVYNNAPVAGSVTDATKWNVPKTYNLAALCSDPDVGLDTVSFGALTSQPAAGTAAITTPGNVRYTPSTATQAASYSTAYSFTYTCTDTLLTGTGTVTITVSNNAPTLAPVSISVPHNYATPSVVIEGLTTNGNDVDGDSLTSKNLQTTDPSVGISQFTGTNTAKITTAAGFVGTKTLTWAVTDGQLTSNTANYAITFTNQPPTCATFNAVATKNAAITAVSNIAAGSSDPNGDPMQYAVAGTTAGTASLSNNRLTYTPAPRRSGLHTVSYTTTDSIGAAATCNVGVTITNQQPIAPNKAYTLEGSHSNNHPYILDYITDSQASDPDNGDVVSLFSVTGGASLSCADASVGSVSLVSGKIQWIRKSYTWVGQCKINVVVRDNDMDNPASSSAVVTITIDPTSPFPPVANDDEYTCDQATQLLQLPVTGTSSFGGRTFTGVMENDVAPLGTDIAFDGIICTTSGYCRREPTQANGIISYRVDTTNCVQDKFQYRIKTTDFMQMTAIGTVTIKFTNCFCSAALDIFFVVDSSSSIGSTNFKTQRNFLINLTDSLDIADTKVKVGIAQFGYDGTVYLSLSGNKETVTNTLTNMPYLAQYTNTLSGIYAALADITGYSQNNGSKHGNGVAKGRPDVPKILVIVTDGVANAPCSCSNGNNRFDDDGQQMTCRGLYGGSQSNYQNACLSLARYPTKTCSSCKGAGANCFPCSDPVKLTEQLNAWNTSTGGVTPPSPYKEAKFLNWKVVAIGVGDLVDNSFGKHQISLMHYDHDPSKVLLATWENLATAVNSVVDAACNTEQ